jgi:hypothetical protein
VRKGVPPRSIRAREDGGAESVLVGVGEEFVFAAAVGKVGGAVGGGIDGDHSGSVVAEEPEVGAVKIEEGFGGKMVSELEGADDGRRGGRIAGPTGQGEVGLFVVAACGDPEALVGGEVFHAAKAATAHIPEERSIETGGPAVEDLVGIGQGDDQGHGFAGLRVTRAGIAETDVDGFAVGRGGQGLDVEAFVFGGELFLLLFGELFVEAGGGLEAEGFCGRMGQELLDEGRAGPADRGEGGFAGLDGEIGREEAVAAGAHFAILVAAVGGDPVDAAANAGGAFDVGFGIGGVGLEVVGQVEGRNRQAGTGAVIDPQDVVFVVGLDKEGLGQGNGGGGVA